MTADTIAAWLHQLSLGTTAAQSIAIASVGLGLLALALFANFLAKRLIASVVHPLVRSSATQWDDLLVQNAVITRFSHLVPALVIHWLAPVVFASHDEILAALRVAVNTYLIVIALLIIDGALNFSCDIWQRNPVGKRYPAKTFIQAAKLCINLVGLVFILSVILGKSPLVFLSGLGALTAVLLLVFKDAILGFVAGYQLAVNNMVMEGDWLEMPDRGADGDVIDVSLTTVKVRNWDLTITTIPTYALISDSFKNWRGMSDAGGRRIKRAVHIDLRAIRFADEELLGRFRRMRLLDAYLNAKLDEIQAHNDSVGDDLKELINGRRLTNVGTFRAYCLAYLRNHPKIHQSMTLLVRQLAPTANGLPIEIYVFTNDTAWISYEDIQNDIFDHLLSVLPEFGLSAYQSPSGADLERAGGVLQGVGAASLD